MEPVSAKEYRKQRVYPDEYTVIILTSKYAVDHFFRLCDEMRIKMSQETKYFCVTEAVANYLQKFIIYRKRKVFAGNKSIEDLTRHSKSTATRNSCCPATTSGSQDVTAYLKELGIQYQDALMYRTVSSDLSDLSDVTYDMLVFFSPQGIESLFDNFPDFKQNDTRIAVFGNSTLKAVEEKNLVANVKAPAPEAPSMATALELYLQKSNPLT